MPDARPTISVIVTNYNYHHFLGACLDSLRAQTRPPDQVIVVDDGSTDGSRAYLNNQSDVTVILRENGGQAAAFNSGFAEATGDAILFLDADDALKPHALATIDALWTGRPSALCYHLDLVDSRGTRIGRYDMSVPDEDLLPRLLNDLLVPFMPTSGNVFARDAIAWAFPLPERGWRISADALLIRAALLVAPFRHINQTLGEYRVHGANNYFRSDATVTWRAHRGLTHIADAGLALANMIERAPRSVPRDYATRLIRAAVRVRLNAHQLSPDPAGLRAFLRKAASPPLRWALRTRRAQRALVKPSAMPPWAKHLQKPGEPVAPRGLFNGPRDRLEQTRTLLTAPEWIWVGEAQLYELRGNSGGFTLRRPPGRGSILQITVSPDGPPGHLLVSHNGSPVAQAQVAQHMTLDIQLPDVDSATWQPDRIVVSLEGPATLRVHTVELIQQAPDPVAQMPPVSAEGGTPVTVSSGASILLGPPPLTAPFVWAIRCSDTQVDGQLVLSLADQTLFAGDIGPNARISVEVPPGVASETEPLAPEVLFTPKHFLDDPILQVAAMGWRPGALKGRYDAPSLSAGAVVSGAGLLPYLATGWEVLGETAVMTGSAATLQLAQGALYPDSRLVLDLAPSDPQAAANLPTVIVTVDGAQRQALRLGGRAEVEVPCDDIDTGPRHHVEIAVFAASEGGGVAQADHGGLILYGLQHRATLMAALPLPTDTALIPPLARALAGLEAAVVGLSGWDDTLAALAQRLTRLLEAGSAASASSFVTAPDLSRLATLGHLRPPGSAPPPWDGRGETWLRWGALAALSGPAYRAVDSAFDLEALPPLDAGFAEAFAAYLTRDPPPGAELAAHQAHLVELLVQARAILAEAPLDSAVWRFASTLLDHVKPAALLFSDRPLRSHVAAFGAALEARLLREGHALDLPPRADKGPLRRRVGILLHHLGPSPEGWIARALAQALPDQRCEVVCFMTEAPEADAPPGVTRVVAVAGKGLAETVAEIRAWQCDILILGASFHGSSFMTEVAAHRLAPRQIAMTAMFPATTGLSSVDEMILGDLVTPEPADADYTEPTVRAPGTGQVFALPPSPAAARAEVRAALGLAPDTVLMTSGAMQNKISPPVLDAWVRILAQSDGALVLYPFPSSWQQTYDTARFAAEVRGACTAAGVNPGRVHLLPPSPHEAVRRTLSAADLYLDSFPYSGATTTVEALMAGCPVVAMAGTTQRGHQAAGWLQALGLEAQVAEDVDDYLRIAVELAGSATARRAVAKTLAQNQPRLSQPEFAAWLETHLLGEDRSDGAIRHVFHHMPKAGGTSLKPIFRDWFDVYEDYRAPWAPAMPMALDVHRLGRNAMIAGHFASDKAPLAARYPDVFDPDRWRLITFVRHPLDRAISIHAYERVLRAQYDPDYTPISLNEFIATNGGLFATHFECDADTWRDALDRYWFIGTLERFGPCISHLARALQKPAPEYVPHSNATPRREMLDPEAAAAYRERNALEFEMYDEINRRLDATLGQEA